MGYRLYGKEIPYDGRNLGIFGGIENGVVFDYRVFDLGQLLELSKGLPLSDFVGVIENLRYMAELQIQFFDGLDVRAKSLENTREFMGEVLAALDGK